jgi:hypothetical protein
MLVENTLPHNLFRSTNEAIQLIAALAKGKFTAEKIVDTLFCGAISSPAPKKVKLERPVSANATGSPAGTLNEQTIFYESKFNVL